MKLKLIAGILISAFLVSCSASRKAARKDDKAIDRITASKQLLERVKAPVDSLWPCIVDTVVKFKPGRIDSVPYAVLVPLEIDPAERKRIIDSIHTADDCWSVAKDAYDLGFQEAKERMGRIKVPAPIHDTVETTLIDKRKIDIADAARKAAEQQVALTAGALSESREICNALKKERNHWTAAFIGLLTLVVLAIGIGLYAKFKPKLPFKL